MSNSKLNKLKSGTKNGTVVSLKVSSDVVGDSNDDNNFPHKLLLTNTQVSRLCKTFANGSSAKITLSKTKKSAGFLGKLLGLLLKTGLPLMKNVLTPLAKSVLIPLGLTEAASATDAAIHEKILGFGMVTLIILNEEINDIVKIVQSLEESGILIKGVSETIKNETKNKKVDFSVCY